MQNAFKMYLVWTHSVRHLFSHTQKFTYTVLYLLNILYGCTNRDDYKKVIGLIQFM